MVKALVPPGTWTSGAGLAGDRTLPQLWVERWAAQPAAPVLLDGWGEAPVIDGTTLDTRTAAVAAALAARGVAPGERVLWCARATLPSIEALLGVLRRGAVLVPVSPSTTASELAHVVSDARPVLGVVDRPRPDAFAGGPPVVRVDQLAAESARVDAATDAMATAPGGRPEDDALIVYTSGTTGRPKGAVHTHRSLAAGVSALLAAWEWSDADRLTLCLPLFHVHGLCAGLFGSLTAGASVVVFDRFDEETVLRTAPTSTLFFGVPTMYHRLAATGQVAALGGLRLCVSGSAPLAAELWHRLADEGVPVLERYGMTETLLTLSNPLRGDRRAGSVGRPLPGVEAALDEVDADGIGELLVRGAPVCRGYWGRPDFDPTAWFATGDLASVAADGYVTIRGRRTELIITGGHNVYPAEVEAVLSRHPGVVEVAVVGQASEEWGETVVAYVVGDADHASLRELAAAELAPFKCPREIRVIDALPRNALGKVVRGDLR